MLTVLVLDTTVFTGLIRYFYILGILMAIYCLVRMAMTLKNGKVQNFLAFIGLLVLGIFGIIDVLGHSLMPLQLLGRRLLTLHLGFQFNVPVAMVFFIFCYALLLALKYAETERQVVEAIAHEKSIAADNAALDMLNRMKSDVMEMVSHETRTPLAVISGYIELIAGEMRQKGVDAQTSADLDKVAVEIQRIASIMTEMQNFSREKHKTEHKAYIQIADIIRQSANLYAPILERKGVKLSVNLPDDLPPIYADSHEFTQVMFNLLQNARNHTENGSVTITAAERDDDTEGVNSIIVTISDTGSGIPPDILPDIFKRGVSGLEGGTGLGLPICKEIINSHGGDIKINSRHGTGTTVSFTIPIGKEGDNGGT